MSQLRVSLVQSAIAWENADANRAHFSEKMAPLQGSTDLVVLPEMFTTGFSMRAAALAEPLHGPTLRWMAQQAAALDAAVAGSFICAEGGLHFNRLIFMRPDGTWEQYDKRHRFALAGEHEQYAAGTQRLTVAWRGWRICPLICYDLRFPVWSRNVPFVEKSTDPAPYDLLLYVANWPQARAQHWRSLLVARAIENQAFTMGVNIVGHDGKGLEYGGDSAIVDFSGRQIFGASAVETAHTTELSLDDLRAFRQQLPFLRDADAFSLH